MTSSTPTSLVVPVPAGATTGTIGVTAPAGSATSSSAFTVTATSGAPTITGFTPVVGLPADTITINGTNFDTVPTNNKVSFYNLPARPKAVVSASTTTALTTVVALNARSGPVALSTPGGSTVSAADFFVPVGGFTAAQVAFTGRIAVGGSSVDVALPASKQGLVVFDGVAGQRLDLGTVLIAGSSTPGVTVYRPDGVVLPITASNTARYLSPLPISGAYTIAVVSGALAYTVRLTLSEEIVGTAVVGGSAVNVSVPRAGQRARLSFEATAGQRVSLGLTHTFVGATVYFKTAGETTLASLGISSPGELHSPVLPSTGAYLLVIEPGSPLTGSFTATLSEEITGTITIDGASVPLSITRAGQRARVTFTGTAGQSLSLGLTSVTVSGSVTVYRPGGATHLGPVGFSTPSGGVDFPGLASTGTHEILIDPAALGTGNVTLTLSEMIAGTTALNGPPVSVTITRPGQAAYWAFSGTAGQRASHVVSGTTITGTIQVFYSGGGVVPPASLPGTTFLETATLPATATYYIFVDPSGANMGSITVTSYAVPADVTGSLSINGGTVPVTLSVPGQNAILSFAGTSGQVITVRVTGNSIGCVFVKVTKPAGGGTSTTSSCAASFNFGVSLTTTGTHTVTIDPQGAATGSATVEVTIP